MHYRRHVRKHLHGGETWHRHERRERNAGQLPAHPPIRLGVYSGPHTGWERAAASRNGSASKS